MAETGSFAIVLPLPVVAFTGEYGGPFPADTSNALDGLDLVCVADVILGGPTLTPPDLVPSVSYDVAMPYEKPIMVNGRPT